MHEIVTLQFGGQSNYIGTHFWNAQEAYFTYSANEESPVDHDIHFRAGVGTDGSETFTPRTVIYDLKDNFGTLRQVNALYEIQDQADGTPGAWSGDPILRQQLPISPHLYQVQLDAGTIPAPITASSVRFWSDFNRVFYHPRSIIQLSLSTSHMLPSSGSQIETLDQWDIGEELFKNEDQEHDLLDRDLRLFAEECDQIQGFQIFAGSDDAWAGFAGHYVERMRDEYGRKSIWVWGAEDDRERTAREKRQQEINLARSTSLLSTQASLYIPVSNATASLPPQYLQRDMHTKWQTSGLQAAAIESATLPTRLRSDAHRIRGQMGDIEPTFTADVRRNVLQLSMSASKPQEVPPVVNGYSPRDHRTANGIHEDHEPSEPEKLDIELFRRSLEVMNQSPDIRRRDHIFSRTMILRGFPIPVTDSPGLPQAPIVQTYSSNLLAPRPSSFPAIFNFSNLDPHSGIAVKTALTASTGAANRMRFLADVVRRSVCVEEREELRADLLAKAEEYIDGWEDEEGSSDDE